MQNKILLETRNLSVGYQTKNGNMVLLENLDLTVRAGELVCFMGPNGIGKSTFIRTIAGLHPPLKGTTVVHSDAPPEQSLAVVLTEKLSQNQMSALDLITFGRYPFLSWNIRLSDADHHAIDKAIELMGLNHPYFRDFA